ncbi:multiheme c-type cytochrome [Pseudomonadota bacterium]
MAKSIKRIVWLFLAVIVFGASWGVYTHNQYGTEKAAHYVTSENCQNCHQTHYKSWHDNTLHPIMFRPVSSPDDIQGDFENADPNIVKFAKDDIEFVIGNKWEQVYARMIDGEYYPLTAKWHITTQKWEPYKVKDWKETPLSVKCNGCHTTGFNPDTYEFSEFGIGCEACHGPGSTHVARQEAAVEPMCATCHSDSLNAEWAHDKDIIVSINSAVCGQCHTRGTQTQDSEHLQTTFNFPLEVVPGNMPSENFKPLTFEKDTKKQHWWGIGLSKNRHQEFADFSLSKHGRALDLLKERHTADRGELGDDCLACHSADYILANARDVLPTIDTATQGLTCAVCHEPHGFDREFAGVNISPAERCGTCHADSMSIKAAQRGQQHYPGPPSSKSCPDCHMPYIVKSGGAFPIRSHAFKIVPPQATRDYQVPNSCQNGGCHEDKPLEWALAEFDKFYGAGRVDDPIVVEECGACHRVFDRASQTPDSWQRIMGSLDTHFGVVATLDAKTTAHILNHLTAEKP